jgi:hypothetical protein
MTIEARLAGTLLLATLAACAHVGRQHAAQTSTLNLDAHYAFSGSVSGASVTGNIRFDSGGTTSLTVINFGGVSQPSWGSSCIAQPQAVVDDTLSLSCGDLRLRLPLHNGNLAARTNHFVPRHPWYCWVIGDLSLLGTAVSYLTCGSVNWGATRVVMGARQAELTG